MLKKIDGRWALVSKDGDKVLKWFGTSKPSDKEVAREERRVNYFKHLAKECYLRIANSYLEQGRIFLSPKDATILESIYKKASYTDSDRLILEMYSSCNKYLQGLPTLIFRYEQLLALPNYKFQEDITKDITDLISKFLLGQKSLARKKLDAVLDKLKDVNENLKDLIKLIDEMA